MSSLIRMMCLASAISCSSAPVLIMALATFALVAETASCGGRLADGGPPDAGVADATTDTSNSGDATINDATDALDAADAPDATDEPPDAFGLCPPVVHTGTRAVAFQVDATHSGAQLGDTIGLPLCRRWSHPFSAAPGYPVVADGRVFVTLGAFPNQEIWALDEATGATIWGPVSVGLNSGGTALALAGLYLIALDTKLKMTALVPGTGAIAWKTDLALVTGQWSGSSAPTPFAGSIFTGGAGSGGNVWSVSSLDGSLQWTSENVCCGNDSAPVVTDGGVFVWYACDQVWGLNRLTGATLMHHSTGCSGGGGNTAVMANGLLYADKMMVDSKTGADAGNYPSWEVPATNGSQLFAVDGLSALALRAFASGSSADLWTFGWNVQFRGPPSIVGKNVVVAALTGQVFVVTASTGQLVSSGSTGDPLPASNGLFPWGMAVADGMLFVPSLKALTAF